MPGEHIYQDDPFPPSRRVTSVYFQSQTSSVSPEVQEAEISVSFLRGARLFAASFAVKLLHAESV